MKALLKEASKDAMKQKDKVRLDVIRALLTAIQYEEIAKGTEALPEDSILAILKKEAKKREEEIEFAKQASRTEIIVSKEAELKVIQAFLPQQFSREKLTEVVKEIAATTPNSNMGSIMAALKKDYAGKYDGKMASDVVKQILAQ